MELNVTTAIVYIVLILKLANWREEIEQKSEFLSLNEPMTIYCSKYKIKICSIS
jgi:hypothetical protein